jgi:hypothetical protein
MQREERESNYLDLEYVVYHYPHQYFKFIDGGEKFVYYRPSRGAKADQASTYIGCGELGDWWPDENHPDHRFVAIRRPVPFVKPVPFADASARMYESRYASRNSFQGQSVRHIDEVDYYRILGAAGLTGALLDEAPTIDDVVRGTVSPLTFGDPPIDDLRPMLVVPEGTGYRPSGKAPPNVFEAAALQERARTDHQRILKDLLALGTERGATCFWNNNIDLFMQLGDRRLLIEAKSLNASYAAVDRMRYGMGQLFDYSVRYKAKIGNSEPVLAFGAPPARDAGWISTILQENRVAFIARDRERVIPLNELARTLPIFR